MSNDNSAKFAEAFADLKKVLAETDDGSTTVVVDRKVLKSLTEEIGRQNNLSGLEKLETEELISLKNSIQSQVPDVYSHDTPVAQEIEVILGKRKNLTADQLIKIVNRQGWEFREYFLSKLHCLELTKEQLLTLLLETDFCYSESQYAYYAKKVLEKDPSISEMKEVVYHMVREHYIEGTQLEVEIMQRVYIEKDKLSDDLDH